MYSWKGTEVSIPSQGGKREREKGKEEPRGKCIEKEIVKLDRTEEVMEKDYFQCWRVQKTEFK